MHWRRCSEGYAALPAGQPAGGGKAFPVLCNAVRIADCTIEIAEHQGVRWELAEAKRELMSWRRSGARRQGSRSFRHRCSDRSSKARRPAMSPEQAAADGKRRTRYVTVRGTKAMAHAELVRLMVAHDEGSLSYKLSP
jgi:hypothetical protein